MAKSPEIEEDIPQSKLREALLELFLRTFPEVKTGGRVKIIRFGVNKMKRRVYVDAEVL